MVWTRLSKEKSGQRIAQQCWEANTPSPHPPTISTHRTPKAWKGIPGCIAAIVDSLRHSWLRLKGMFIVSYCHKLFELILNLKARVRTQSYEESRPGGRVVLCLTIICMNLHMLCGQNGVSGTKSHIRNSHGWREEVGWLSMCNAKSPSTHWQWQTQDSYTVCKYCDSLHSNDHV